MSNLFVIRAYANPHTNQRAAKRVQQGMKTAGSRAKVGGKAYNNAVAQQAARMREQAAANARAR